MQWFNQDYSYIMLSNRQDEEKQNRVFFCHLCFSWTVFREAARYTVRMSKITVCLIVFLLLPVASIPDGYSFRNGWHDTAKVKEIFDGDTIGVEVEGRSEKIRLIGIDAPEMDQRPWGKKAKQCIASVISASGPVISLEYDVERRDKYGRLLAYLWTQDRRLLNEELVFRGCSFLYTVPPNVKYAARLRAAQKKAYAAKTGIWGENGLRERPSQYRKEHPRR